MKNKILIGAGILLTILVIGLILVCGASTTSNTVTQEQYEEMVDRVQVEIDGGVDKNIPLSILTDNIQFNAEIEDRPYTKLNIINKQNYKTKGIVFLVKSQSSSNVKFLLYKNDELLKSTNLSLEANQTSNVVLLLDNSVQINTTDKFYVLVDGGEEKVNFVFDSLLSFFDEE